MTVAKPLKYFAVAAIFCLGVFAGTLLAAGQRLAESNADITGAMISQLPDMGTDGYVKADVSVDSENIYLEATCRRLAMETNVIQTYAINAGMQGIRDLRPMTHDVIKDIMDMFGIEPIMVKIVSYEQGAYFARIAMRQGARVLNMDIRPSDAIAIAVRSGTPVYVNQTLLGMNGKITC